MPAVMIEGPGPGPGDDDLTFTPRGFAIYADFTDTYGNSVRVQESSSAEGPHIWIFAEPMDAEQRGASPHLNLEQTEQLIEALQRAVARGKQLWGVEP